uniref:Uncharacterized protein n=1 Tax=Ixodes ricinus TaxID=34613 RepID=A0A6B0UMW9_IXORI
MIIYDIYLLFPYLYRLIYFSALETATDPRSGPLAKRFGDPCSKVSSSPWHTAYRVFTSSYFVLYVLLLNKPVLASNNNELPRELSYQCSFLIFYFRSHCPAFFPLTPFSRLLLLPFLQS